MYIFARLKKWEQEGISIPNLTKLEATVRAYGAYAYTFMGETWCQVAAAVAKAGSKVPPGKALGVYKDA